MPECTPEDLANALKSIGYGLGTMTQASARISANLRDGFDVDAYRLSFALRARALTAFFIGEEERSLPTCIKRTDFAREWNPQPAEAARRLRYHQKLLRQWLAYQTWESPDLTWETVGKIPGEATNPTPAWDHWKVAPDILAVADEWSRLLDYNLYKVFHPWVVHSQELLSGAVVWDPELNRHRRVVGEPRPPYKEWPRGEW